MPGSPRYRYVLADLLTDRNITALPLTGVGFDRRISRTGAFKGNLDVYSRESAALAELVALYAGRSALWVYRGASLWWGGILWTASPSMNDRSEAQLALQASTFDSYAHHRDIREDITYTGIEQTVIIADLWNRMQNQDYNDIGVLTTNLTATGILRDRTYLASEAATFGQRIEELGDVIDGVEHTIDVYATDLDRTKTLNTGNPRLHVDDEITTLVTGTRLPSWSQTVDATNAGTHFQARGDASSDNVGTTVPALLSDVFVADDLIANGWPQLDSTTDHQGVKEKATLDDYAQAERDRLAGQAISPSYNLYLDENTSWHPNQLGSYIRIQRSKDDWFSPGKVEDIRPVAVEVSVPDRGGDAFETVKVTVETDALEAA